MIFWLWFEIVVIFVNRTLNLKGIMLLSNFSYLFKNDKKKNMSCTKKTISIYYKKLQKKSSRIHSYEKDFL
jgi:hypothetical protein